MLTEVVRLLSDPRLGNGDSELGRSTGWRLLPFLVVTSPSQSSLAAGVARSRLVTQHPLTLNWAEGDRRAHERRLTPAPARLEQATTLALRSA